MSQTTISRPQSSRFPHPLQDAKAFHLPEQTAGSPPGGGPPGGEQRPADSSPDLSRREMLLRAAVDGESKAQRRFANIPLNLIDLDSQQVRTRLPLYSEPFRELCANVTHYGILQPVFVCPSPEPGRYTLIAGESRYHAARQTGLATLPCYIDEGPLDSAAILLRQLSENLHRRALSHLDLAHAFHTLTLPVAEGGGGLKAQEVANLLGKSNAFVSEHKMLLYLSAEDQQQLEDGTLSFDKARAKLRLGRARGPQRTPPPPAEPSSDPSEGPQADASVPGGGFGMPDGGRQRLTDGQNVYAEYSRCYPDMTLSVLVAGLTDTPPALDAVVRAVSRHLQVLKLEQRRESRAKLGSS